MKCPKCGYISFDYNQVCPKCNKNISTEQEMFNLPAFRPDPPSLLGFLTGDANESNVSLRTSTNSHMVSNRSDDIDLNDSVILNQDNLNLDDQDLDISFEPESSDEYSLDQEAIEKPEKSLSDSDFSLEKKKGDASLASLENVEDTDISLDLGDFSLEEPEEGLNELADSKKAHDIDSDISIESLDSLSADASDGTDEIESELELNLDDLKISDVGELELGADQQSLSNQMESTLVDEGDALSEEIESEGLSLDNSLTGEEKLPDLDDLMLEEKGLVNKKKAIDFSDFSMDDSEISGKVEGLELSDEPIDKLTTEEDESFDLEEFNLDSLDTAEPGKTIILDNLSTNDSGELEKSFDLNSISLDESSSGKKTEMTSEGFFSDSNELELDLDAMSLDVEEYQKGYDSGENDFVLDIEDMDIDLDLNEPKK
jgi:hypothetical protein